MDNQPLIEDNAANVEVKVGATYRATSIGGITRLEPTHDDATRQAQVAQRLASLGGTVHGKDGRAKSLATRANVEAIKLLEEAKKNCKNPIKLSWKNIIFEVEVKQNEQEVKDTGEQYRRQKIVKDCSGFAAPGVASYIMGSSGAGKTSLLNILSDRVALINKAKLSGQIIFNDTIPVNQDAYARYAAYVM